MIAHALTIVNNELVEHLKVYGTDVATVVSLGNMAEGFGSGTDGTVERENIIFSLVNIREDKAMKNLPNYVRNEVSLRTVYENPPVFLNFLVLVTVTHQKYKNALTILSRVIRFFQSNNVFTHDSVLPASLVNGAPDKELDRLETFKLIYDLYSPTMEEVNHLWGTLGGKQYPFVMYQLRMMDLKFKAVQSESGLITEVQSDFYHKNAVGN